MKKPSRIRWSCPSGEHPGALAPTRLRKIDIRRFCIPCSEFKGVLTERVAPALEARKKKRVKKVARKKKKKLPKPPPVVAGVNVVDEVRRIEALDVVIAAYTSLERTPVGINVRCRRKGDYTTGYASYLECRVTLTFPLNCSYAKMATLVAHEIAHIATATGENHGMAWRDMFLAILRDGYNFEVEWPRVADTEKPASYMAAHQAFEQLLEEKHGERRS